MAWRSKDTRVREEYSLSIGELKDCRCGLIGDTLCRDVLQFKTFRALLPPPPGGARHALD